LDLMSDKTRVLFVCHGNICRSPLAEAVFRNIVQEAGVSEEFEIDSAGTSSYHEGEAPDPRTCAEASARGIMLNHSSRPVNPRDFDTYDYILAMDAENMAGLRRLCGSSGDAVNAAVRLLRSFDATSGADAEVPDPYYGGPRGFSDVHDMVERACRGLLAHLRGAS
jgi:protein-tyrosine phosphatase